MERHAPGTQLRHPGRGRALSRNLRRGTAVPGAGAVGCGRSQGAHPGRLLSVRVSRPVRGGSTVRPGCPDRHAPGAARRACMSSDVETLVQREYKYGFVTDIESDVVPKGLNEDIVRLISAKKGEPGWLLEWRL